MSTSSLPRARPCPFPGCSSFAVMAETEEVLRQGGPIWRCGAGHRGPSVIGLPAEGDLEA